MPPRTRRLPLTTDLAGLRTDVDGLQPADWAPHFNTAYYEGDWSGAPLRSVGGLSHQIYPDPSATAAYADTPILARCPHTAAFLAGFSCPLLAVRYLRLGPGARIREHTDLNLGAEDGEVRIHVPVRSNDGVLFLLDGDPVEMGEGEAWYLDLNLRHAVVNGGTTARVHLVVDCVVDDWLGSLLEER